MYKVNNMDVKKSLVDELIEDKDVDQTIVKSFYLKEELCPDVFVKSGDSHKMIENVRTKLLNASDAFVEYLGVDFFIYDVILTGSLANYNWSEYSDVDLHILMNFEEIGVDIPRFKKIMDQFFKSKKNNWNTNHDIKIKRYEVELYVQDSNEQHHSSGVYSVLNDKWEIEPKLGKVGIDDNIILIKSDEFINTIDDLTLKYQEGDNVIPDIEDLRVRLKKFRQSGLETGGEFSYENLVFKLLRRNGYIEKLFKLKRDIIDKKLSVTQ